MPHKAVAPVIADGCGSMLFTIILTGLLVPVEAVAQLALLVSTHDTTSVFASVVELNVVLLEPTFVPLTFHWYDGVLPPLAGVAVKATLAPAHIVDEGEAAIVIPGVTELFTVMVTVLLVPVVDEGHIALLVITHVTALPFASELVVKVVPPVPALEPLTFH